MVFMDSKVSEGTPLFRPELTEAEIKTRCALV